MGRGRGRDRAGQKEEDICRSFVFVTGDSMLYTPVQK